MPKKEKGKMHEIVDEVIALRGLLAQVIVLLEGFIQQFTDAGMLATAEQLTGYVQELKKALQSAQEGEK